MQELFYIPLNIHLIYYVNPYHVVELARVIYHLVPLWPIQGEVVGRTYFFVEDETCS
jgi:hypothetical protein